MAKLFRCKSQTCRVISLLCLLLLAVNFVGVFSSNIQIDSYTQMAASGVPGYDYALEDSRKLLDNSDSTFSPDELNQMVFRAIEHNKTRRVRFTENWLLWSIAKLYPAAATTQNPKRIAKGGIGLCSEASLLLNYLATINGYQTRFAKFPAHVVSEIKTNSGWHYFDPDYGISFPADITQWTTSTASLYIANQLTEKGFDDQAISNYKSAIIRDNQISVFSVDGPLSPRLHILEVACDFLMWLIPLILLGVVRIKRV